MSESVAVLMTVKSVWAAMVRLVCAGRTGALFTSLTVTVNVLVSLSGGEPLSTTRTVNVFVLGPCASVGVHVITPEGEMAAPVGAESKVYVSVFAGISGSVAVSTTVINVNSLIVRSAGAGRTGALLTSSTVTVKELVALFGGAPLSVATVVIVKTWGPCASVGVQVITPLASIVANGVITWTPTEAQGPHVFTITTVATDNGAPPKSATNSFTVTVLEVNSAPVLPAPADRTINELTLMTVVDTATDPDIPANTLTYSLLSAPTGAAISPSGVITW